jgi:hypothetical protein
MATAVVIFVPPAAPITSLTLPIESVKIDGDMDESGRFPIFKLIKLIIKSFKIENLDKNRQISLQNREISLKIRKFGQKIENIRKI